MSAPTFDVPPLAFDVFRLREAVNEIIGRPSSDLIAEYTEIADAHRVLGQVLASLSVKEAAE